MSTAALRRVLAFTGALALGVTGTLVATPAPAHAAVTNDPVPVSPAAGSYVSDWTPTFSWEHGSGGFLFSHAVQVKDAGGTVRGSIVQFTSPWVPWIPLADGAYTWEVRGQDLGGPGTWSAPVPFVIDTRAPNLTLTAPASGTFGGGDVTVTGTVSDANRGTVTLTDNGTVIATDTSGASTFSFTFTPTTGSHSLVVTAVDKAGNSDAGSTASVELLIDADAPSIALLSPSDGSYVQLGDDINFHATATDANTVEFAALVDGSAVASGADVGYVEYQGTVATGGWADGSSHVFEFTATDEYGQTGSVDATVTVDGSAPAVAFTAPARFDALAGVTTVVGTATDATSGLASLTLRVRPHDAVNNSCGASLQDLPVTVAADGTWSVDVDTTTFPDGSYCLTALAIDNVGNSTGSSRQLKHVTFDNTAPQGTLSTIFPSGFRLTADRFEWSPLTDPNGVTYEVRTGLHSLVSVGTSTTTTLAYDHPTGPGFWQVRAVDDLGNATPWTASQGFQVVGVPEIVYPTAGLEFSASSLTAEWTPSSGVGGVSHYEIEYGLDRDHDGVLSPEYRTVPGHTAWPVGNQSRTQGFPSSADLPTGYEGPLSIRVRAVYNIAFGGSVNGPWSAPTVSYLRDTAKPTVTIDAPDADAVLKGDTPIPVTVTGSDAAGISQLVANLYAGDGSTFLQAIGSTPAIGALGTTATRTWNVPAGLAEGDYVIRASSKDAAGKVTATSQSFTIDRTKATVKLLTPTAGSTHNSDVTVTAEAADAVGVDRIVAYVFDATNTTEILKVGTSPASGSTAHTDSWVIPIAAFPGDGTYIVRARVIDLAGNSRSVGTEITIDTTGPEAPQPINPQNGLTQANDSPVLDWIPVSDAVSYELRTSTSPGRTPNANDGELNGSDAATIAATGDEYALSGLGEGWLWWQVRGIDALGNIGPWSNIWATGVDTTGPVVTLTSPADAAVLPSGDFTLQWASNESGSTYELRSSTGGATDPVTGELLTGTTVTPAAASLALSGVPEGSYFWQVRATDGLGNVGAWAVPFALAVDLPTLAVPPTDPPAAGPAGDDEPVDLTTFALEGDEGDETEEGAGGAGTGGTGDEGSKDDEPKALDLVPTSGVDTGVMWLIGALVFAALLLFFVFMAWRRRSREA